MPLNSNFTGNVNDIVNLFANIFSSVDNDNSTYNKMKT